MRLPRADACGLRRPMPGTRLILSSGTPCRSRRNGASMIVMKFGGTSVQDAEAIDRVAAIVRQRLPERPVVVVSALAKITDQLLAMAAAAGAGKREQALDLCRAARE